MGPMLLKNIVEELNALLSKGVISKVQQSDERNIVLKVFVRGKDLKLLISAHPAMPRMHITEYGFPNPPRPLRFCAFLRSRLTGALIEDIHQDQGQRIVRISLKKRADRKEESFTLIAEFTGKSANIILVDNSGIVGDSLRHFPPESYPRPVMPGIRLEPLPLKQGAWKEEHIEKKEGLSWNKAADLYYCGLLSAEEASGEKGIIRSAIKKACDKAKRLVENLNSDKEKAQRNLGCSKLGELILSNMHSIKKGVKEALLVDYSALPPAKALVELDQRLSPYGNAERYFKKAKKAKTALNMLGSRIAEAEAELEYLDELEYGLEEALTKQDLDELKSELVEGGYMKALPMEGAKAVKTRPNEPVRKALSSEGFTLLCGKSAKGNDLIVKKYAKDKDIWLHASGVPGSHVLIKTAGKEQGLTEKTIIEAAGLAAWHSKSRKELKAEVIYTEAKNVFKPKGAHPGMVMVKEYRSIMAAPKDMSAIEGDD